MDDLVERFSVAIDRFAALLDGVGADQWTAPTPCAGWDVRELVNHVAGEQLWAPHLLAGETIADVGDRYDGDVLGDDPVATWAAAAPPSVAAFDAPGALDGVVHLSYGDEQAREYLAQMLTDAAVHGWDLATAVGAPSPIDPGTASFLLAHWRERQAMVRGSGVFGDAVAVPAGAGDEAELLGLLGRTP